nr:ribonuclease H-like domain-containing protein [Tanacetum cinerariifolium]GEW18544.1 ribonuclease H-like domain-containing protein [Tanacetum cinerariifolium]
MEQPNPTFAKILILDTGKFEQWKFRIQQYLQNRHYALWEVIEFGDSYEAPLEESGTGSASESSAKKKGRTVAITTEDIQKRRNDVKARTILLLALPDEHQLRFSKYETAQELDDLDTMSLDDVYNHLKVYEPEVQKKSESNSQNMAFISSAKTSSGKGEVIIASILTDSTQVSPASADVAAASISHDTVCAYIASQSNGSQIKYEDINQIDKDDIEEMDIKWNMVPLSLSQVKARLVEFKTHEIKFYEKIRGLEFDVKVKNNKIENLMNELEQVKKEKDGLDSKLTSFESASKDLDTLLGSQRSDKNKEGLGYSVVPPPPLLLKSTLLPRKICFGQDGLNLLMIPLLTIAEAVNTACYVKNRVLVNKSQNKTPYELFNSRTPAIAFLRPFGCHVMILNTLDHIGKFDAKGDEGYFIGYRMSSKAFRVFNKRIKKVKENMHVNFLENKLIEKGADPNWLFDIDILTNSTNYVPVVVAGTTSNLDSIVKFRIHYTSRWHGDGSRCGVEGGGDEVVRLR